MIPVVVFSIGHTLSCNWNLVTCVLQCQKLRKSYLRVWRHVLFPLYWSCHVSTSLKWEIIIMCCKPRISPVYVWTVKMNNGYSRDTPLISNHNSSTATVWYNYSRHYPKHMQWLFSNWLITYGSHAQKQFTRDQILVQDAILPLGPQIDEKLSWFLSLKRIESLRKVRKWGDEYICFPDGSYLRKVSRIDK